MTRERLTKQIGEVCEIVNGGTPKTGVPEYWGGKHLWITPAEMGKLLNPYVNDTQRKITDAGLQNSSARLLPAHSVILSSRAPIGHLVINTKPMATNQGCKGLIPGNQLNYKYLYYYLSSIVQLLNSLGTGATFKELSGGKLKEVTLPVPPLAQQQRIVRLLDEAFAGLATAQGHAEKNLQNASALFQVHLNQFFDRGGKDWKQVTFGSVVIQSRGGISIKSTEYSESGIPVLTKGDIKPLGKIEHGGKYVERTQVMRQRWPLADPGDLIVATRDLKSSAPFLGLVSRVPKDRPYLVNQGATYFKVDESLVLPDYFVHWCCCARYRAHVVAKKSGATQVHIREADLFSAPLHLPTIKDQRLITASLDALSEETQRLATLYSQKLAALAALKQSLLHQAFSGNL